MKWVPVTEWGIGNENEGRGISGLVLDMTNEGARRIGTFSGNYRSDGSGGFIYDNVESLKKRYSWLCSGAQSVVSLI